MLVRSRAPLRLGFAGGGTDVSPYSDIYGGAVLNATISMYAHCFIEPLTTGKIIFESQDNYEIIELPSSAHLKNDDRFRLHIGVYNRIVKYVSEPLSFKLTTYSDVLPGSGLGSSSSMVVAMLQAFVEWLNIPLGKYEVSHLAFEIERVDLGLQGGKQDQYASAFGGFNFMEFLKDDRVIINPLRVKDWVKNELEVSMVLFDTSRSRESAAIIREQVKNVESRNKESIEAMNKLKEGAYQMKEMLLRGDLNGIASMINEGWQSKKKMADSISNASLDDVYNYAMKAGAVAGKVSGAGGGGFFMFLTDPSKKRNLFQKLSELQGTAMHVKFEEIGATAWKVLKASK